jgi:hypothetical protein
VGGGVLRSRSNINGDLRNCDIFEDTEIEIVLNDKFVCIRDECVCDDE